MPSVRLTVPSVRGILCCKEVLATFRKSDEYPQEYRLAAREVNENDDASRRIRNGAQRRAEAWKHLSPEFRQRHKAEKHDKDGDPLTLGGCQSRGSAPG